MRAFEGRARVLASTALALAAAGAPAGAAERHAILFAGERLEIVDRGGLAIWQGDILLGRTADLLEATRAADLLGEGTIPAKGTGLGTATGRWPRGATGLFEIPYVIENDPDGGVPPAIVAFNEQLAGFARAVPRGTQADYVAFSFDANDTVGPCFSSIGRVGGRQLVGGARNCSVGRLVHELGHAMGLFHEQERADRASWVSIDLGAVDPSLAYNYVPANDTRDLGAYDFGSIMHYGATGFSKYGALTMESIPPGIAFGQRNGYSRGDLDALRRLYGVAEPGIVVDTYPSGLTVLVDGIATVTPATFSWPIGSRHVLDVPAGAQTLGTTVHAFARWNVDAAAALATRQEITVAAGDGTLTNPGPVPATTVYTANFVRMKPVKLSTSGNRTGVGGTLAADPPPVALAGASGAYYRERQPFALTPTAGAGATFARWRGTYSFPIATSTNYTPQMRGPLAFSETQSAYEFIAHFVDYPFTTLTARAQGADVLGISATVQRANGSSTVRLPYNTADGNNVWAAGESGTATLPATAIPFAQSVRYALVDIDGAAATATTLTHPAAGQASATRVATYRRQYEPYRQVNPSCAGSLALGTNADGWVDHGAAMAVTLAPNPGWSLAQWRGSLSGTGNARTLAVTDVPDIVADLNIVAAPLAVTGVSPARVESGRAVTLEIEGTGFAAASRVLVGGVARTAAALTANRITVPLAAGDYPATGKVIVTVQNRPGGTGSCALNASGKFESVVPDAGTPRLANIATRGAVRTGDGVMIAGFVIGGAAPKTVLVTARGPSLAAQGVAGTLANPVLQLFSGQTPIAANDDWGGAANAAAIQATGIAPADARESALLVTLNPGAYTAIVSGSGGATGVAIVEVFERDRPDAPLANLSTRGNVLSGDGVMIGGLIVNGSAPRTVLIRARGPSLAAFGLAGTLADPALTLYSGQTPIATNDDWGAAANAAAILATGLAPPDARESAILVTLDPGAYTAIVSGSGGATGLGIVEVFAQ